MPDHSAEQAHAPMIQEPCTCKPKERGAPDSLGCRRHPLLALLDEVNDLRSRLACVVEATYWDRPYDERIAAVRGMCDLKTNGLTPQREPSLIVTPDHLDQWAEDAITQGIPVVRYVYGVLRAALDDQEADRA